MKIKSYDIISLGISHWFSISLIVLLVIKILNLSIIISCLAIHIKYVKNFMNKINVDFERKKNDYKWNLVQLIYSLIFWIYLIVVKFGFAFFEPEINGEYINNNDLLKENIKTNASNLNKSVEYVNENINVDINNNNINNNKYINSDDVLKQKYRKEITQKIESVKIEQLTLKNIIPIYISKILNQI